MGSFKRYFTLKNFFASEIKRFKEKRVGQMGVKIVLTYYLDQNRGCNMEIDTAI